MDVYFKRNAKNINLDMVIEGLSTIYKIENENGEIYIGQTSNWKFRFKTYQHIHRVKKQKYLYRSLKKYGVENHQFHLIEICEKHLADEKEKYWIKFYNSYYKNNEKGLNLTVGGASHKKSKIDKQIKNKKVPILQYSQKGDFIKMYKNIVEAISETNMSWCSIYRSLRNQIKTKSKFQWVYWTEDFPLKIDGIDKPKNIKGKKPLLQYDLQGNFIKEWESICSVSKTLDLVHDPISFCLSNKLEQYSGFQWKTKYGEKYPTKINPVKARLWTKYCTIKVWDKSDGSCKIFNDAKEMCKILGISYVHFMSTIREGKVEMKKKKLYFEIEPNTKQKIKQ